MLNSPKWTGWIVAWAVSLLLPLLAVAAEPTSKPSPPDATAMREALNSVNDVYKNDIASAKTAETTAVVVARLTAAAKDEKDAASRFALLSKAREVTVESGDYDGASAAVDAIAAAFDFDSLKLVTVHALTGRSDGVGLPTKWSWMV